MVARLLSCSGLPKAQQVAGHGNPPSLLRRAQAGAMTLLVSLLIVPIATPAVPCTPRRPTPRVRTRRLEHARRLSCTPRRCPRARPLPTRRARTQGVGCINSATRSGEAYLQRNRVCAPRRAVAGPPPLPLHPIERGLTAWTDAAPIDALRRRLRWIRPPTASIAFRHQAWPRLRARRRSARRNDVTTSSGP